jgi:hypothetical protein
VKKSLFLALCFFRLFSIAQKNDNYSKGSFKLGANLVDNTGEINSFMGLIVTKGNLPIKLQQE